MSAPEELPAVIVAGASAGGVEALGRLVRGLPADLASPLIVVLHVDPAGTSVLPEILSRAGRLPARAARDGEDMQAGHIHVAPPDHHLIVEGRFLRLSKGPRENGHRPALDPTMRSVADVYGPRSVGVVLSGNRDDGSAGLARIKEAGGLALVQDPGECAYDGMPRNAIERVAVDGILAVDDLAVRLAQIAGTGPGASPRRNGAARPDPPADSGASTRFPCPDCGGVLFEHDEGGVTRFRCSVGHAYSAESLDAEQERELDGRLWAAVRSLEDRAVLLGHLAGLAAGREQHQTGREIELRAADCLARAAAIRAVALGQGPADDRT